MKGFEGEVVSAKMKLTAIVEVKRFYRYPLYGKIIARKGKIHAHNDIGAVEGQKVQIIPCRPYAKTVAFRIDKILSPTKLSISPKVSKSTPLPDKVPTKAQAKSKPVIKTSKPVTKLNKS